MMIEGSEIIAKAGNKQLFGFSLNQLLLCLTLKEHHWLCLTLKEHH